MTLHFSRMAEFIFGSGGGHPDSKAFIFRRLLFYVTLKCVISTLRGSLAGFFSFFLFGLELLCRVAFMMLY